MNSFYPPDRSPKLSLLYKCRNCGKKINLLSGIISKKCPRCGQKTLKVSAGMSEYKPNPLDDLIRW